MEAWDSSGNGHDRELLGAARRVLDRQRSEIRLAAEEQF